jgi:hypothetical protein
MPLKSGKSQETVGKNIKELERSYKKTGKIGTSKPKSKKAAHKQAVAIALNKAGKSKKLKESYDDIVNSYLKTYLLEMDIRQDPREGFGGDPFVDPTEDMGEGKMSVEEMREVVAREAGEEEAAAMSDNEIQRYYYAVVGVPEGNITPQEMYDVVAAEVGEQKASMMSGEEIKQYYYDVVGSYPPDEDQEEASKMNNEEECESAKQGCNCGGCPDCSKNDENKMLQFYGFTK